MVAVLEAPVVSMYLYPETQNLSATTIHAVTEIGWLAYISFVCPSYTSMLEQERSLSEPMSDRAARQDGRIGATLSSTKVQNKSTTTPNEYGLHTS